MCRIPATVEPSHEPPFHHTAREYGVVMPDHKRLFGRGIQIDWFFSLGVHNVCGRLRATR